MREIKFRAWDKNQTDIGKAFMGQMWYDLFGITEKEVLVNTGSESDGDYVIRSKPRGDFILMQYTGLKDDSSPPKEIYEGDLLKIDGMDILPVVYQHGAFYAGDSGQLISNYAFKVIGNIYENKDLIS